GGFLDDLAAGRELGAAQNVAAADDDRQLHAALVDSLDLPGDAERFLDRNAALGRRAEALAGELQHDPAVLGAKCIVGHDWGLARLADDDTDGRRPGQPMAAMEKPRPTGRGLNRVGIRQSATWPYCGGGEPNCRRAACPRRRRAARSARERESA